jgi:hypothetical protein
VHISHELSPAFLYEIPNLNPRLTVRSYAITLWRDYRSDQYFLVLLSHNIFTLNLGDSRYSDWTVDEIFSYINDVLRLNL